MNYANADMVGHSGKLEAAIKAVEAVDSGLARIYQTLQPRAGLDYHRRPRQRRNHDRSQTGGAHTYHTTNPVPFVLVTDDDQVRLQPDGALRDIAPTLLGVLGRPQPKDMTAAICVLLSESSVPPQEDFLCP